MGGTEGQFINNSDNGEGRGLVLLKLRCTKQWAKIENLKEKKKKNTCYIYDLSKLD